MREMISTWIAEQYSVLPEYPWAQYPEYAVYRHSSNAKWFALIASVPKSKLNLAGEGNVDLINVKCDDRMIGSLLEMPGFLPAYHMSKAHWVSILLDGTVSLDTIKSLLDMSYDLTNVRKHKK